MEVPGIDSHQADVRHGAIGLLGRGQHSGQRGRCEADCKDSRHCRVADDGRGPLRGQGRRGIRGIRAADHADYAERRRPRPRNTGRGIRGIRARITRITRSDDTLGHGNTGRGLRGTRAADRADTPELRAAEYAEYAEMRRFQAADHAERDLLPAPSDRRDCKARSPRAHAKITSGKVCDE